MRVEGVETKRGEGEGEGHLKVMLPNTGDKPPCTESVYA
jgi:hypothetical protein